MTKQVKFEEGLARLEEIVEEMENGEMDLEKSLALFEEGIKLVRFCSGKLEEDEKEGRDTGRKKGDKMVPEPFSEEDAEKETDK
jgi:exodeoxyribonuclease VII, small subunit